MHGSTDSRGKTLPWPRERRLSPAVRHCRDLPCVLPDRAARLCPFCPVAQETSGGKQVIRGQMLLSATDFARNAHCAYDRPSISCETLLPLAPDKAGESVTAGVARSAWQAVVAAISLPKDTNDTTSKLGISNNAWRSLYNQPVPAVPAPCPARTAACRRWPDPSHGLWDQPDQANPVDDMKRKNKDAAVAHVSAKKCQSLIIPCYPSHPSGPRRADPGHRANRAVPRDPTQKHRKPVTELEIMATQSCILKLSHTAHYRSSWIPFLALQSVTTSGTGATLESSSESVE